MTESNEKLDDQPAERKPKPDDTYSEAETVARREAALKRMLATPHKPHKASPAKPKESQPNSR